VDAEFFYAKKPEHYAPVKNFRFCLQADHKEFAGEVIIRYKVGNSRDQCGRCGLRSGGLEKQRGLHTVAGNDKQRLGRASVCWDKDAEHLFVLEGTGTCFDR
jgi:hypothetical protein